MCYNDIRAPLTSTIGAIAESKKGHDKGRLYLVIAVLNADFVLTADGKYRPIDKPKQKRFKHLKSLGVSKSAVDGIESGKLTNADIIKALKEFSQ